MSSLSFEYKAINNAGTKTAGVVEATSEAEAYRRLSATGLTPVSLRTARKRTARRSAGKVSRADVAHITYQLSVLLEARIPIVDCFRNIADQEDNPHSRAMLSDIAARIEGGSTVTNAFKPHEATLGTVYIETVHAAETSGNMIPVLAHLAEMLEEQDEMNRLVRSAMAYPIMVVIALSAAILILLTFVVPKFASMFEQRGVDLPILTKALIAIGHSLRGFWWAYIGTAAGSIFTFKRLWRDPKVRVRIDRYLAKVPYLSRLLRALALGRFANVFGLSLGSGIGLLDSLEMGGRASARPLLIEDVDLLMDQVKRGGKLSEVLRSCKYITPFVRQLLSAGEESAEMSRMCKIISTHYSREATHLAKHASTIVEPILIAGLTVIVLVVALAIFIPMWDMVSLV